MSNNIGKVEVLVAGNGIKTYVMDRPATALKAIEGVGYSIGRNKVRIKRSMGMPRTVRDPGKVQVHPGDEIYLVANVKAGA